MNARALGGEVLRLLSWLVGAAITLPVVAGYVALGAALLVGRSLRLVAGGTRRRSSPLGGSARHGSRRTHEAA
jgi:hypothetical protein